MSDLIEKYQQAQQAVESMADEDKEQMRRAYAISAHCTEHMLWEPQPEPLSYVHKPTKIQISCFDSFDAVIGDIALAEARPPKEVRQDIMELIGTGSAEPIMFDEGRFAVLEDIELERRRQDSKYGGESHDNRHHPSVWLDLVQAQMLQAEQASSKEDFEDYRKQMIQIAALAVASVETLDRQILRKGQK